jgi:hypothetical protein
VVDACVLMVSVDVTAPMPEMAAGWEAEQVGASDVPDGLAVIAHASATLPVKPPLGVTVIVELVDAPCAIGGVAVVLNEKLGGGAGAVTVKAAIVVSTVLPAVPVTIAV